MAQVMSNLANSHVLKHSQDTQLYKLTLQLYHCHDRFSCSNTCRRGRTYTITRTDPAVAIEVNPPTMTFQFGSSRTLLQLFLQQLDQ
uniref:Uncharacterized protein n=1 Tax=Cucumis sativus TaxID=3659 RepID=A0A0A0LGV1_CUCSA